MVINDQGQIIEVWEPGDTEIKKIPWIPVEHQVQPIPGVTIPYGNWANWSEPARVDLAGHADGFTSEFVIEDGAVKIKKCTDENVIKTKVRYANKGKETNQNGY